MRVVFPALLILLLPAVGDAQIRPFAGQTGLVPVALASDPDSVRHVVESLATPFHNEATEGADLRLFVYTVRRGDTLSQIASRHATNMGTIYSLNPELREGRLIKPGLNLLMANMVGQMVTIQRGDSLPKIVGKFEEDEISLEAVRQANKIPEGASLKVGAKLFVPGARMDFDEVQERTNWYFILPVSGGRISSCFSHHRVLVVRGRRQARPHHGVDVALPTGTPVKAARSGRVTFAGRRGGYGKLVIIQHSDGVETRYGHLSSISVRSGQRVSQNQMIGRVGSTGNSTGPHLHLEYRVHGVAKDPTDFIRDFKRRYNRRC